MGVALERIKEKTIDVDGSLYARIPVRTHVLTESDDIADVAETYAMPLLQKGDLVFISEKAVAITQGRAYRVDKVRPSFLARLLSCFVTKTPHGIGLGIPETMEFALREVGVLRILLAAIVGAITRLFGRRGDFYRIAGPKARGIDGPTAGTIPPYNQYVVLVPDKPDQVARRISQRIGADVAIVDVNDLGGNILGTSHPEVDRNFLVRALRDNPLGQGSEGTPIGILRKAEG